MKKNTGDRELKWSDIKSLHTICRTSSINADQRGENPKCELTWQRWQDKSVGKNTIIKKTLVNN